MSASFMQMIYIDSEQQARQTNVCAAFDTNEETWRAFRSAKSLEVPAEKAMFLLDYYNRRGVLVDTICLDAAGFKRITGEKVLTDEQYRQIDREYWREAMADLRSAP